MFRSALFERAMSFLVALLWFKIGSVISELSHLTVKDILTAGPLGT